MAFHFEANFPRAKVSPSPEVKGRFQLHLATNIQIENISTISSLRYGEASRFCGNELDGIRRAVAEPRNNHVMSSHDTFSHFLRLWLVG